MIDHLSINVASFERSRDFYDRALGPIGAAMVMMKPEEAGGPPSCGYGRGNKPSFWITQSSSPHSGLHIAFVADKRAGVDAFHRQALEAGGRDNGAPGLRAHYHPNYYAAFVFDPDGNNVEAVCHLPEQAGSE
ncbi:VOC family protein [Hyphomonas chukchiensis]|uniref:VOC family protein n=1 Tax=Hyphomonas chukchiensis TaxID=1280947 RepID=UPI0030FA3DF9|tara:strand:- start:1373 stop:1771 length:399 start_codon:yes stop_codon:yes gene_type:complete